jgi:dTDP-4-amino-4,6-dideoxygalactose transaminase
MKVPLLDLKAQYTSIRDEIRTALDRVVEAQTFILGPEVKALESEIASYCGSAHAIGVSSGTDALLVAMMALDIKPGDEVITSPYSFSAAADSIARLGATPVFVDINPRTFNIEPAAISARLNSRTRAIIPVHLFGQIADMTSILEIAHKSKLHVIEDAAQAIGAELNGLRAGSIGDMGCISFYPSKNLGGFGDGGMITTKDGSLADRIRLLRSHGSRTKYYNELLGGNFRLDEIQAAVLRVKLRHLETWTEARRRNAALYRRELGGVKSVTLPSEVPNSRHVFNQFVIRSKRRDSLMSHLKEAGIGCEIYYPVPLHLQPCFSHLGGHFPESEAAAKESLALPVYPELSREMIQFVAESVANAG